MRQEASVDIDGAVVQEQRYGHCVAMLRRKMKWRDPTIVDSSAVAVATEIVNVLFR